MEEFHYKSQSNDAGLKDIPKSCSHNGFRESHAEVSEWSNTAENGRNLPPRLLPILINLNRVCPASKETL